MSEPMTCIKCGWFTTTWEGCPRCGGVRGVASEALLSAMELEDAQEILRQRDVLERFALECVRWGAIPCNCADRAKDALGEARMVASEEKRDQWQAEVLQLRARLVATTQILVAEVGAEGPMSADEVAMRAVRQIQQLRAERDRIYARLDKFVESYRHVEDVDPVEVAEAIRDGIKSKE